MTSDLRATLSGLYTLDDADIHSILQLFIYHLFTLSNVSLSLFSVILHFFIEVTKVVFWEKHKSRMANCLLCLLPVVYILR